MPPSRRLPQGQPQYDIAGMLGNGAWGYLVGIYDKDAGPDNQRLYPNGARVAQMSDTLPIDLNSAALGIGRHVSGIADPFNGHIDEFRIAHVKRSDGWIETTWNNMSDPGAFAVAGAEEQDGGNGEPPPLAGAGVVVCLMGEGQRSGRQESSTAGSRSLDEADVPFFGASAHLGPTLWSQGGAPPGGLVKRALRTPASLSRRHRESRRSLSLVQVTRAVA